MIWKKYKELLEHVLTAHPYHEARISRGNAPGFEALAGLHRVKIDRRHVILAAPFVVFICWQYCGKSLGRDSAKRLDGHSLLQQRWDLRKQYSPVTSLAALEIVTHSASRAL